MNQGVELESHILRSQINRGVTCVFVYLVHILSNIRYVDCKCKQIISQKYIQVGSFVLLTWHGPLTGNFHEYYDMQDQEWL